MKQGEENTKFIKDSEKATRAYIFQKNKKTKTAALIIIIALIVIVLGIVLSGMAL